MGIVVDGTLPSGMVAECDQMLLPGTRVGTAQRSIRAPHGGTPASRSHLKRKTDGLAVAATVALSFQLAGGRERIGVPPVRIEQDPAMVERDMAGVFVGSHHFCPLERLGCPGIGRF